MGGEISGRIQINLFQAIFLGIVTLDDFDRHCCRFWGGILSLTFLMKIIKMGKMLNFSYYCCGMGILMIIFI
jgi:hypothetical protein